MFLRALRNLWNEAGGNGIFLFVEYIEHDAFSAVLFNVFNRWSTCNDDPNELQEKCLDGFSEGK